MSPGCHSYSCHSFFSSKSKEKILSLLQACLFFPILFVDIVGNIFWGTHFSIQHGLALYSNDGGKSAKAIEKGAYIFVCVLIECEKRRVPCRAAFACAARIRKLATTDLPWHLFFQRLVSLLFLSASLRVSVLNYMTIRRSCPVHTINL